MTGGETDGGHEGRCAETLGRRPAATGAPEDRDRWTGGDSSQSAGLGSPATARLRDAWRRRRLDAAAVGLLWFLCALFLWRLFSPIAAYRLHVVSGDFTNQFYPFRYFAAAEWRAGRLPLWNPYIFAGHPFLADLQTAVFYPPSLANALIGAVRGFSPSALELEMALHYPLAALFTYMLALQLTRSRVGALVAAVAFTFSGFLTSYPAQQLAMLEAAVWLPLIVLLLELAATRPARAYRWHVAAGLALAACLLAGHSQTALFVVYASLAYLVCRGVSLRRGWRPTLAGAAIFIASGLGLAAIQLLPAVELLGLSVRASLPYDAAAYGYERRALLGVLLPNWRGEKALYVGVLPLLLAGYAVARRALPDSPWPTAGRPGPRPDAREPGSGESGTVRAAERRPLAKFPTLFFAGLALVALALSVGGKFPLYRVAYTLLPGYALFRDQERTVYIFAFAVALLAGAGAADLVRFWPDRSVTLLPLWRGLAGMLALSALGSAALLVLGGRAPSTFDPHGTLAAGLLYFAVVLLASVAVLCLPRLTRRTALGAACLVGLVAADLFAVNLGNNLSPADPDPGPRFAPLVATLSPAGSAAMGDFRVRGESDEAYPPNYAAVWGLPTISGDTPFAIQRVSDFLYAENAEWRRWQVLNVKYFISQREPFEGVELVSSLGDLRVYRVVYSLPRAWAVRDVQVAVSPADALRRVLVPAQHPGDTVVLEEAPALGPYVRGDRPDVRVVAYTPQRVEIATRGDANAVLVLADTYYPGWRALLDGAPVRLLRADYVVRAVELPPGEHRVELVFDPATFKIGVGIASVTALACALLLWSPAWLRR